MAEWLGRGLQNLVQRFESASDLTATRDGSIFFAAFSPMVTSCVFPRTANYGDWGKINVSGIEFRLGTTPSIGLKYYF